MCAAGGDSVSGVEYRILSSAARAGGGPTGTAPAARTSLTVAAAPPRRRGPQQHARVAEDFPAPRRQLALRRARGEQRRVPRLQRDDALPERPRQPARRRRRRRAQVGDRERHPVAARDHVQGQQRRRGPAEVVPREAHAVEHLRRPPAAGGPLGALDVHLPEHRAAAHLVAHAEARRLERRERAQRRQLPRRDVLPGVPAPEGRHGAGLQPRDGAGRGPAFPRAARRRGPRRGGRRGARAAPRRRRPGRATRRGAPAGTRLGHGRRAARARHPPCRRQQRQRQPPRLTAGRFARGARRQAPSWPLCGCCCCCCCCCCGCGGSGGWWNLHEEPKRHHPVLT